MKYTKIFFASFIAFCAFSLVMIPSKNNVNYATSLFYSTADQADNVISQ